MPKPPVISDAELQDLLKHKIPVERIAALYGVSESRINRQIAMIQREDDRTRALAEAQLRAAMGGRPFPPEQLLEMPGLFAPSGDLLDWSRSTFLSDKGALYNPEHRHLAYATIGFLWTSMDYQKQGRTVAGLAEMPTVQGNAWLRARMEAQLTGWFGLVPTFLITLHAGIAAEADDASFCALVEHEILHCGQKKDEWGFPAYSSQTGLPLLAIRGHDAEEFVSIVRRYGVGAAAGGVAELVEAAGRRPAVAEVSITKACGTCRR